MQIVEKKWSELIPYENNPRLNEEAVKYVEASIKEFGFKVPIVVDKDNVIVAGHTRWKAAERLGMKTVPCIVADDLTPEQVKAYRLADNKVSEFAGWDFEKLDLEMDNINLDMGQFGFLKVDFDFDGTDEVSESNYEQPEKEEFECPQCHHVDTKTHFKRVKS